MSAAAAHQTPDPLATFLPKGREGMKDDREGQDRGRKKGRETASNAGASKRFRKWGGYKFVRTLYSLVVTVVC